MNERCPRCDEGVMRSWDKLGDAEREVVKRLPASADYPSVAREATHRWCTRCWFEATSGEERLV